MGRVATPSRRRDPPQCPAVDSHGSIIIRGARENNLKDVSLDIPKRKITVFTGVSGSGKSSLVFDTIAAESQRLINETYHRVRAELPAALRPARRRLAREPAAAIIVDQQRIGGNSRSTVGTVTDAYTMLRVLFARLGEPHGAGTERRYSFNDPRGMCPDCEGIGEVAAIDEDALVDDDKSLNEGALAVPDFAVGSWFWKIFTTRASSTPTSQLGDYTAPRCATAPATRPRRKVKLDLGSKQMNSTYEGLSPSSSGSTCRRSPTSLQPHIRAAVERISTQRTCAACDGTRLNAGRARDCRIDGTNIAECSAMEVARAAPTFIRTDRRARRRAACVDALATRLEHLDRHRPRLPQPRPPDRDAVRRRVAAGEDGAPPRLEPHRHDLHLRRAQRRPAPARRAPAQRAAARSCATRATRCWSSSTSPT